MLTAVGWNSIYFLLRLLLLFRGWGGGPAKLISHCCQSNSTLSCNYFQYISIHISFRCHPNKIYKGSVVQSLICSTDPKTSTRIHIRTHRHTRTQASSHHPARGVLKWELWRFLWNKKKNSKNAVCVSSPASFSSGKSLFFFLRRVPTTFPVRLTRNEALCHCHIASPSCRSMTDAFKGRYIWWARSEKVWGGGKKRGTDIERVAEKKNGRQIWIHCDRRVKAYKLSGRPKMFDT